jgi:hypothetical protein
MDMDKIKTILGALLLLLVSAQVSAAVISVDDSVFGIDSVTQDSESGLDWLDVVLSVSRSFHDVSSQFGTGGDYQGWRYATGLEFVTLFDNILGNNAVLYLNSVKATGSLIDPYVQMLGPTRDPQGFYGEIEGFIDYPTSVGRIRGAHALDSQRWQGGSTDATYSSSYSSSVHPYRGSWLVRETTAVPAPSIIALFALGLVGIGIARRKR